MKKILIIFLLMLACQQAHADSATGGTVTNYTDAGGTNWYAHIFTNSGTFTPSQNLTVEYLVIGGGGAGGGSAWGGGGGGAGGYRCSVGGEKSGRNSNAETVTNLTSGVGIDVGVGIGGTGAYNVAGNPGSNSWFGEIIALGGGGGGGGGTFGSGGGASYGGAGAGPAGTGTVGQGCAGGPTYDSGVYGGGGGGGALTNGNVAANGSGGDGLASSITGTSVARSGGGKGGGNGGGGAGSGASNAGGGGNGKAYAAGLAGKTGIVIVRYVAGGTPAAVAAWYEWQPNLCFQPNQAILDGESAQ
jgi:hypothetical protein